jgi:hypothetical protein
VLRGIINRIMTALAERQRVSALRDLDIAATFIAFHRPDMAAFMTRRAATKLDRYRAWRRFSDRSENRESRQEGVRSNDLNPWETLDEATLSAIPLPSEESIRDAIVKTNQDFRRAVSAPRSRLRDAL